MTTLSNHWHTKIEPIQQSPTPSPTHRPTQTEAEIALNFLYTVLFVLSFTIGPILLHKGITHIYNRFSKSDTPLRDNVNHPRESAAPLLDDMSSTPNTITAELNLTPAAF